MTLARYLVAIVLLWTLLGLVLQGQWGTAGMVFLMIALVLPKSKR
jgi:hypothetical protein